MARPSGGAGGGNGRLGQGLAMPRITVDIDVPDVASGSVDVRRTKNAVRLIGQTLRYR